MDKHVRAFDNTPRCLLKINCDHVGYSSLQSRGALVSCETTVIQQLYLCLDNDHRELYELTFTLSTTAREKPGRSKVSEELKRSFRQAMGREAYQSHAVNELIATLIST